MSQETLQSLALFVFLLNTPKPSYIFTSENRRMRSSMQDNELRECRAFRETFTRQKCHMEVVKTLPALSKLAQKKAKKMQEDNKLKADLMALFAECKSSGSVISPVASPMTSPVHSADKTKFSRRHQGVAVYYHDLTKVLQDCKDEFHHVSDPVVKNTRYE